MKNLTFDEVIEKVSKLEEVMDYISKNPNKYLSGAKIEDLCRSQI